MTFVQRINNKAVKMNLALIIVYKMSYKLYL